ncbi:MAG TPA: hypothetical protein VIP05_35485 [Burkholderiaceae bacterium]
MKARLGDDRSDGNLLLGGKGLPAGQVGRGVAFGGGQLAGTTTRALLAAPAGPSLVAGGSLVGGFNNGGSGHDSGSVRRAIP